MKTTPKVSVLIPTYNYAHFLDETIQSVLQQTFSDFELIIVDNCSTDDTHSIVQKYLSDSRVFFHRNEVNVGLVGNWNKCLQYANGEYIKFLCADDKFHPQMLERYVPLMDDTPDLSLITAHNEVFGSNTRLRKPPIHGRVNGREIRKNVIRDGGYNWLYSPSVVMFRRKDVAKAGWFNDQFIYLIDTEYWMRLLNLGDCYIVPEVLCYCRAHEATQTTFYRKKRYAKVFESYQFVRCIKNESPRQQDREGLNLDNAIKERAYLCARVMYKMLPLIYRKENRSTFNKAYRIAYREGVLIDPVINFIRNRYRYIFRKCNNIDEIKN